MGVLQEEIVGDIGAVPTCKTLRVRAGRPGCLGLLEPGKWALGAGNRSSTDAHCHQCEGETTFVWKRVDGEPRSAIRDLNDRFRRTGHGNGTVVITRGVQDRGPDFVQAAFQAVRSFDAFSEDNDPWGEHDFGAVEIDGEKVFWKLDYYDPSLTAGSENPANEAVTHRVLTIMLASEY